MTAPRVTWRRVAAVFACWLAVGLWNPTVGGVVFSLVVGVVGLRFVARFWRAVYRWCSA